MKLIATMAAIALAGTAQAQQPAPRPAQRAPAQAQRPQPQSPGVPTRVNVRTLTALCAQDRNGCLTYVLGATDAFASALVASGRPQVFCFPNNTTNDQIAQAVVRYLRAHPEEGGSNAALLILAGLSSAFPCGY
jgi:hypothetical protein